ncbi:hypothetical protein SeLEV6574_g06108 [Synchytrium endobioticum]|uniref:Sodium/calcium exchanger membrane region domain-containing protein n=1 Tax=Synchytrium endobioticum TaxID=286115 RepID=A0A507CQH3_9FUNG|nr:hypothetical protein SeLEV6574_g06108 [Synchytrium endobioticum]
MRKELGAFLIFILLNGLASASSNILQIKSQQQVEDTPSSTRLLKRKHFVDLCVDIWSQPDPCSYIKSDSCAHSISSQLNYAEGFFCAPTPAKVFMLPLYTLWLVYLFIFAGIVSSDFFAPSLSALFNMFTTSTTPSFFVSILLLALGNGSFDLLASTAAMKSNSAAIAFGGLIGSAFIVSILTPGWVALLHPYTVVRRGFVRDCLFTLAGLILIFITLMDNDISVMESWFLIAFYFSYLFVRVGWKVFVGEDHRPVFDAVENDDDIEDGAEPREQSKTRQPLLARVIDAYLPVEPDHLDGRVQAAAEADTPIVHQTQEALAAVLPRSERKSVYGSVLASNIISDPMEQAKYTDRDYLPTTSGVFGMIVTSVLVITRFFMPQFDGTRFSLTLSSAMAGAVFAWGFVDFWHFRLGAFITLFIVIVVAVFFGVVALTIQETQDFNRSPHLFYRALGVVASFSLIYILANEAVGLVVTMALIMNLSKTLVGLSLFAVGLSFGDLIANVTLASHGYPSISTKATLASPMLNLTGGTGLAALYVLIVHHDTTPSGKLALITSPSILAATICLFPWKGACGWFYSQFSSDYNCGDHHGVYQARGARAMMHIPKRNLCSFGFWISSLVLEVTVTPKFPLKARSTVVLWSSRTDLSGPAIAIDSAQVVLAKEFADVNDVTLLTLNPFAASET